jgi:alpha-tubulin suppressor-like RCC1 family protein
MNEHTPTSTRTRTAVRWALPLLLALGLLALTPVRADAAPLTGVTQADGLNGTTCVRTNNGQARCWGEGAAGQNGNGLFSDTGVAVSVSNLSDTGPLVNVVQVSSGGSHSCAVLTSGRAVCWGDDAVGQLANGAGENDGAVPTLVRNTADTAPLSGIVEVQTGSNFTCFRLQSTQVRCAGGDSSGQVGDGGALAFEEHLPQPVASASGEGFLTGATQLTAGNFHACVRLNNGQARCWGQNNVGQLGINANGNRAFPVTVKSVSGVAALEGVTAIAGGGNTTCARISNGTARCWGEGSHGELGNADDLDAKRPVVVRAAVGINPLGGVLQIAVGQSHTCFRIQGNQLRCSGDGTFGQLANLNVGNGPALRPVVARNSNNSAALGNVAQVTAGANFTCARLTVGQMRCWGSDNNLSLGNGADDDSDLPTIVVLP